MLPKRVTTIYDIYTIFAAYVTHAAWFTKCHLHLLVLQWPFCTIHLIKPHISLDFQVEKHAIFLCFFVVSITFQLNKYKPFVPIYRSISRIRQFVSRILQKKKVSPFHVFNSFLQAIHWSHIVYYYMMTCHVWMGIWTVLIFWSTESEQSVIVRELILWNII